MTNHHFVLPPIGRDLLFRPQIGRDNSGPIQPVGNIRSHVRTLSLGIRTAASRGQQLLKKQAKAKLPDSERGLLVRFDARTSHGIDLEFFSKKSHGLELLSSSGNGKRQVVRAFAHEGALEKLDVTLHDYGRPQNRAKKLRPKFSDFFDEIASVQPASIARLWNPPDNQTIPKTERILWEVWLRRSVALFVKKVASEFHVEVIDGTCEFPTATVLRMRATYASLRNLLESTASVIELRPASLIQTPLSLPPTERVRMTTNLAVRIQAAPADAPVTAILDTGVANHHPLLIASLPNARLHTVLAAWPKNDANGHGTQMAGAALFGDLSQILNTQQPIQLTTALESVTVLGGASPRADSYTWVVVDFGFNVGLGSWGAEKTWAERMRSCEISLFRKGGDPCGGQSNSRRRRNGVKSRRSTSATWSGASSDWKRAISA